MQPTRFMRHILCLYSTILCMLTEKLKQTQLSTNKPTVLVIGDLMIDHYITGQATRLSPEAPVPVVNVGHETVTLGGAGNVVENLLSLGAQVLVSGITGNDLYGNQLSEILQKANVQTTGIVVDDARTTTVKTRVLVGSHQMIRIDREVTHPLCSDSESKLLDAVTTYMSNVDIVILSDYNKGLFSNNITQHIIDIARGMGKRVVVDPKGLSYVKYKGSFIIKPNRKELCEAANVEKISTDDDLLIAARTILSQTQADYLVVTLSEDGMAIISNNEFTKLPVKASEVFDVTGAGDTALAAMAYALASGFNVEEACNMANYAAAIVIKRIGSATTNIPEILDYMSKN
jgi:rfaE bifunctional protein kinase chain/domain